MYTYVSMPLKGLTYKNDSASLFLRLTWRSRGEKKRKKKKNYSLRYFYFLLNYTQFSWGVFTIVSKFLSIGYSISRD